MVTKADFCYIYLVSIQENGMERKEIKCQVYWSRLWS